MCYIFIWNFEISIYLIQINLIYIDVIDIEDIFAKI